MKNTRMSGKITVSFIGLMSLSLGILGILSSLLFLVSCGGDEAEDAPEVSISPNPLADGEEGVSPVAEVPPADDKEEVPGEGVSPVVEVPLADDEEEVPAVDDGSCKIGDILAPRESCIDPGTGDTFSVLADGRGRYLFITAGTGITLRGSINGIRRNFVATKRNDGSWEIESVTPREDVGGNPDNPNGRCQIPPLNKDFAGKVVLFIDGDIACVLLSDGNFVSFACKAGRKVIVVGGPVQMATKALVQFGGFDALNKDGVAIPDGELTEFEVSDAFVGDIELKDNRTTVTINVPNQDGNTIKGNNRIGGLHNISRGVCIQDLDKERPAVTAELAKYAKDLLDIMRENR